LRSETQGAIRAARIAQQITDSRTGADRLTSKAGIDLVTGTDLACEDAIRSELLRSFPEYAVIGEERGGTPRAGQPYWLVDPICGTRTFASDIPLYCTNIALVEDGEVTVAALGIGRTGEVLYAERGHGARMQFSGADLEISVADSSNTIWIDGHSAQAADVLRRTLLSKRWYVLQFPSSLAYAYVAIGRIAAVLQFSSKSVVSSHGSVHSAAGCFIAREAGAIVTDILDGNPWRLETAAFLMTATAELHRSLSDIVATGDA
jgi:myo-inositol-1(or 4)-monophosphatase